MVPKKITNFLEQFEDSVGGRQTIIDNLSLAALDKKEQHFLNLLSDPRRTRDSINTIARDAGLRPIEIIDLFRSTSSARAVALSMHKLSEALPAVVQDIAEKSVDSHIPCPMCLGEGLNNGETCIQCSGRGQIVRYSDLDRQKIILEAGGITKKQAGVQVNQNVAVGIVNPGNFYSRFVKDSDQTAYNVVDAEVKDSD